MEREQRAAPQIIEKLSYCYVLMYLTLQVTHLGNHQERWESQIALVLSVRVGLKAVGRQDRSCFISFEP